MHHTDEERDRNLALVDQMEDGARLRLTFPGPLEKRFEKETRAQRSASLRVHTIILISVYASALLFDFLLVGDRIWFAALIRLTLYLTPQVLIMLVISRGSAPAMREGILAMSLVTATIGTLSIVLISDSPLRVYYTNGIIFVLLYVIGIERLRFRYALAATISSLVVYGVAISHMSIFGALEKPAIISMATALAAFTLYVNFMFELHERRLWLRAYGDRLRASQFEQLAAMDPMTGLGNRRDLENWLDTIRAQQPGQAISFVVADIDHFKSYNDTFGHMQGDDCIRNVARALSEAAGTHGGRTFRFGGEEFVIVLLGQNRAQTWATAEAMRQGVLDLRQPHPTTDGPGVVSCSFGYASDTLTAGFDMPALITEADFALYAAKRAGRNQVMPPEENEDDAPRLRMSA